jgi:hypothetical protein
LAVAITRQMKALNLNPRMVALTVGVDPPKFYESGAVRTELLRSQSLTPIAYGWRESSRAIA